MIFFSHRAFFFVFPLLFHFSCSSNSVYYEKEFYERISNIILPENVIVIESIDNAEFLTAATFRIDSIDIIHLMKEYEFVKVQDKFNPRLFGVSHLTKEKPDLTKITNLYYRSGTKGKNSWLYLVDIERKLIWAEIQYPDAAGH